MQVVKRFFENESKVVWLQSMLFLLAVALIPFHEIHKFMRLSLFGSLGSKLSVYPVFAGLLLWGYRAIKYKHQIPSKKILYFLAILIGWQIVSSIHGLMVFPAWGEVRADQFHFAGIVSGIIGISADTFARIWFTAKLFEEIIIEFLLTFGTAVWGYTLFKDDCKNGMRVFCKGMLIGTLICMAYSVIESFYLMGSGTAQWILRHINYLFYTPGVIHGWWPPLFFPGRMRSVFAEPSYLALYLAAALPLFAIGFWVNKKKKWILGLCFLCFMLFATQSKTALALFVVQVILFAWGIRAAFSMRWMKWSGIALLCMGILLFGYFSIIRHVVSEYQVAYHLLDADRNAVTLEIQNKGKGVWPKDGNIYVYGIWCKKHINPFSHAMKFAMPEDVAPGQAFTQTFVFDNPPAGVDGIVIDLVQIENSKEKWFAGEGNAVFRANLAQDGSLILRNRSTEKDEGMRRYIENMAGIFSLKSGSNISRYSVMAADLTIGMEHMLLGSGNGVLKQPYVEDALPEFAYDSDEVQSWVNLQHEQGLIKSQFPVLNEVTNRFAQNGFVGVLLFLLPVFYVVWKLVVVHRIWAIKEPDYVLNLFFVAFLGVCLGFFSNSAVALYTYWLFLGIMLSCCEDDDPERL